MASDPVLPSSPPRCGDGDSLISDLPFMADYAKSSSPPPAFSSDDSLESADVTNYDSPRIHRSKRKGAWYANTGAAPPAKRAKATRNNDSGVWMWSDDSDASTSAPPLLPVHKARFSYDSHTHIPPQSSQEEEGLRFFNSILQSGLVVDSEYFNFASLDLHDKHIRSIGRLNTIIKSSPDPGNELPSERQYRALIPRIHVNLMGNQLRRLAPSLFDVQHITTLNLCCNPIEELPPQIGQLRNLNEIALSHNKLKYLPFEFLRLFRPYGSLQIINNSGIPWLAPKALDNKEFNSDPVFYGTVEEHVFPHHPAVGYIDNQFPPPRYLGRTLVSYLDQASGLIRGSPKIPTSNNDEYAIVLHSNHDTDGTPSTPFQPPPSHTKTTNSLVTMSLHAALRHKNNEHLTIEDLRERIGECVPPAIDDMLLRALSNSDGGYDEFRKCHVCSKEYVVARAEWIEWWHSNFTSPLPFKVQVCSWGCVPEEMITPKIESF